MTPSDKISPTVFVVADDQQQLDSLEILLDVLGFAVRPFTSLAQFLSFYRPQMPGCLLVDIHLVDSGIHDIFEQVKERSLRLATIVIAESADQTALAPDEIADVDILARPIDREALVDSVHKALALDVQWRLRDAESAALEDRIRRLNDRDRETLQMILSGETNKSMAARFFLSERAAKMRRSALLRKLRVRTVAELTNLTGNRPSATEPHSPTGKRQFR
jgi:FixJ family two-component response regulator